MFFEIRYKIYGISQQLFGALGCWLSLGQDSVLKGSSPISRLINPVTHLQGHLEGS